MNRAENGNSISTWMFNPVTYLAGNKILWVGLLILLLHIPAGYFFGARFDGALDMHIGTVESLWQPLIDILIAWPALFLSLYLLALGFKSSIRLLDIAGATAVARVPILIAVIPAKLADPGVRDVNELLNLQGADLWILITGSIIALLFFIWFIILLFNAYKINSALKGWRLYTSFFIGLIIAEVISKAVLFSI